MKAAYSDDKLRRKIKGLREISRAERDAIRKNKANWRERRREKKNEEQGERQKIKEKGEKRNKGLSLKHEDRKEKMYTHRIVMLLL